MGIDKSFCMMCNEEIPCKCILNWVRGIDERLKKLEEKIVKKDVIDRACDKANEQIAKYYKFRLENNKKKPFKCPVCDGKKIHKSFLRVHDQIVGVDDNCICCEGKGIVWG